MPRRLRLTKWTEMWARKWTVVVEKPVSDVYVVAVAVVVVVYVLDCVDAAIGAANINLL